MNSDDYKGMEEIRKFVRDRMALRGARIDQLKENLADLIIQGGDDAFEFIRELQSSSRAEWDADGHTTTDTVVAGLMCVGIYGVMESIHSKAEPEQD